MNILQKFANSNSSLPRNMELFLSVSLVVARGEQHEESDLMFFVELKDPTFLLCLILKKNWNVYVTAK